MLKSEAIIFPLQLNTENQNQLCSCSEPFSFFKLPVYVFTGHLLYDSVEALSSTSFPQQQAAVFIEKPPIIPLYTTRPALNNRLAEHGQAFSKYFFRSWWKTNQS